MKIAIAFAEAALSRPCEESSKAGKWFRSKQASASTRLPLLLSLLDRGLTPLLNSSLEFHSFPIASFAVFCQVRLFAAPAESKVVGSFCFTGVVSGSLP